MPQAWKTEILTSAALNSNIVPWFAPLSHGKETNSMLQWQCQTMILEWLQNIVRYAHRHLPAETPIEVEIIDCGDAIEIRIWDFGPVFDLEQKLQELPPLQDNQGFGTRGLKMIQEIADRMVYQRCPDDRNCLILVKRVP